MIIGKTWFLFLVFVWSFSFSAYAVEFDRTITTWTIDVTDEMGKWTGEASVSILGACSDAPKLIEFFYKAKGVFLNFEHLDNFDIIFDKSGKAEFNQFQLNIKPKVFHYDDKDGRLVLKPMFLARRDLPTTIVVRMNSKTATTYASVLMNSKSYLDMPSITTTQHAAMFRTSLDEAMSLNIRSVREQSSQLSSFGNIVEQFVQAFRAHNINFKALKELLEKPKKIPNESKPKCDDLLIKPIGSEDDHV